MSANKIYKTKTKELEKAGVEAKQLLKDYKEKEARENQIRLDLVARKQNSKNGINNWLKSEYTGRQHSIVKMEIKLLLQLTMVS